MITQKKKKLLLKDLCARLPYGVKFACNKNIYTAKGLDLIVTDKGDWEYAVTAKGIAPIEIDFIKPYLLPMSSMTKKQKKEYYSLADDVTIKPGEGCYFGIKIHCIKLGISDNPHEGLWDDIDLDAIDWLNKNHFDYRGLIEKGLAIDATELNIY